MNKWAVALAGCWLSAANSFADSPHNLILFVPDGLRSQIVDAQTAPTMARLRAEGVDFRNSHSLFPTFTTANASAFATGHGLGDTGDFSNTIYSGFHVAVAGATVAPFLEADPVLRQLNNYYRDNYLDEASIVALAKARGYATAVIGKLGPTAVFDVDALKNGGTLIVDDSTGSANEIHLPPEWKAAFESSKVSQIAPSRGDNGISGSAKVHGTLVPNLAQEQYFIEVAIKAALPHFKELGKPFVLVFWSRDPDGTQHNQGDSFLELVPGINGPTALAAVRNADTALGSIEQALKALSLFDTTNILVAADHGFSTISKHSATSPSIGPKYRDTAAGDLPVGFLAIDLFNALKARDLKLSMFDPDDSYREVHWTAGDHPAEGSAVIGEDPDHPQVVIASNGGSDLIYLPENPPSWGTRREAEPLAGAATATASSAAARRSATVLAQSIVKVLLGQDYVSGVFVDEHRFGRIPGTLPTEAIGVGGGRAVTPHPDIVVNFASIHIPGCKRDIESLCAAEVADSTLQQGQGMHGSFSRADTWNFMAARGPDFRSAFVDELPASNADIGMTMAYLLGVSSAGIGPFPGRVLHEALGSSDPQTALPEVKMIRERSARGAQGLITILNGQSIGAERYLDAAGFAGRTVGPTDR